MNEQQPSLGTRPRPLQFGVHLQGQRARWDEYLGALHAVEDLGFGSVWTFDHLLPFSGPSEGPCFETLTTLGAMCMATTRVRLGALVNGVVYRHPAVLAKATAQLDQMSGGRVEFSLGAGWAEREFQAYGMGFPSLAERYERLDEALELVKLLWSEPRAKFHGRYYHVDGAPCEPKPLQSPHPPITVGGSGAGALRVAARHADRLNIIASPQKCEQVVRGLHQQCRLSGRDASEIEISIHTTLALATSDTAAQEMAADIAGSHEVDLAKLRDTWMIGDPTGILAQFRRYTDAGVSHFVFALGYPFDLAPLELFQRAVLPLLP
jgi:F420-dependent oxidoreductase-like protein